MSGDADYGQRLLLQAQQRADDQLIGEIEAAKGGPVLNLLAQSRQDAAKALDQMIALIRTADENGDDFRRNARIVSQHLALMDYAKAIHLAGKNAYQQLEQDDRLAISQGIVSNAQGDTTLADD